MVAVGAGLRQAGEVEDVRLAHSRGVGRQGEWVACDESECRWKFAGADEVVSVGYGVQSHQVQRWQKLHQQLRKKW